MISRVFSSSRHHRCLALAGLLASWAVLSAPGLSHTVFAAPGDLDPGFGAAGKVTTDLGGFAGQLNDQAFALAIQRDGKMVVGGRSGTTVPIFDVDFTLVRYNADGTLDSSFGSGGKVRTDFNGHTIDEVLALLLQPDDKIVAAGRCGSFPVAPGTIARCDNVVTVFAGTAFALARYNTDGSLDGSFGGGGKVTTSFHGVGGGIDEAHALARQADGKIVAVGLSIPGGGKSAFALARYNTDGSLDVSFGSGGKVTTGFGGRGDQALAVAVQSDGRIIVAGISDFSASSGPTIINFALARYNPDGSLDATFGTGGKVTGRIGNAQALALQPDGRILLAGSTGDDFAVERYNSDGSLDVTFGSGGRVTTDFKCPPCGAEVASALALQPNGKILVAGWSNALSVSRDRDFALVRYNPDGSLDVSFGSGGKVTTDFGATEMASALALQADGNIVAAGSRCVPECLSGKSVFALARYQGGPPSLAAAVLPGSRSVQVGVTATAFSTIIAVGGGTATSCGIAPATLVPATFLYQTTDPATNLPTGSPNTPADIVSGRLQTFVLAFTPTAPFAAMEVQLTFDCTNTDPAGIFPGVSTLLLSSSASPVPDIVALAATLNNDGIVNIPGVSGTGIFAVATVNVGASGPITASADTGSAVLPVNLFLCQTNPTTGQCLASLTSTVTTQINANATPTFGVFVQGRGTVPFDPANNRVFVRFKDGDGVTRGSTSVAARTQ